MVAIELSDETFGTVETPIEFSFALHFLSQSTIALGSFNKVMFIYTMPLGCRQCHEVLVNCNYVVLSRRGTLSCSSSLHQIVM